MIKYEKTKEKLLKKSGVKKEYEAQRAEYEIARTLIEARLKVKMTQKEVAAKMKTSQSQIARIESGEHFPSLQTIFKYAKAINSTILISIE